MVTLTEETPVIQVWGLERGTDTLTFGKTFPIEKPPPHKKGRLRSNYKDRNVTEEKEECGRGVDHPTPSSAEVKEGVHIYCSCPSGPSWTVLQ
jgi:hypothetical protein